jgi:hypothetical protein
VVDLVPEASLARADGVIVGSGVDCAFDSGVGSSVVGFVAQAVVVRADVSVSVAISTGVDFAFDSRVGSSVVDPQSTPQARRVHSSVCAVSIRAGIQIVYALRHFLVNTEIALVPVDGKKETEEKETEMIFDVKQ